MRFIIFAVLVVWLEVFPAYARVGDLPQRESGPPIIYTIEVLVCRAQEDLRAISRSVRETPSDEELAAFNSGSPRCAYVDEQDLVIIGERDRVTIDDSPVVVLEVEHMTSKERGFAFTNP